MTTALESLLDPIGRIEFRERYYGNQPLLIRGHSEKLAGLFTWDDLNRLLNTSSWPNADVELSPLYAQPNSARSVIEQCRAGASLVFDKIDESDRKVGEFVRALSAETGEMMNAVLFMSHPSKSAYPLHYDRHDVFVLQVDGHKAWSVYDRTIERPIPDMGEEPQTPPSEPSLICELAPGDVLYVPRGHWHQALAQRGLSLHLTFGFKARTGIAFLRWLIDESQQDVRLRHELPLSFADEPADVREERLRHYVERIGDILLSRLRDRDTIPSFIEHCIVSDRDVHPFKFPVQLLDAPGTKMDLRRFSRPARQRAAVNEDADGNIILSVWGNIFSFPKASKPLIELIVSRTAFGYEDALANAGELTEDGLWEVLNSLLREGILDGASGG